MTFDLATAGLKLAKIETSSTAALVTANIVL
jgi:hypothetical protein